MTDARLYGTQMHNLPDPQTQPEFYDGVPTKRLLAWVVDVAITAVLTLLLLPFTGFLAFFVLVPFFFVIGFAYRTITIARGSATWGMRLFAIELRQSDGRRFDLGAAFFHTLGHTICITTTLLQVISIVLTLSTERGQGLTDHVMGTVAINKRR